MEKGWKRGGKGGSPEWRCIKQFFDSVSDEGFLEIHAEDWSKVKKVTGFSLLLPLPPFAPEAQNKNL